MKQTNFKNRQFFTIFLTLSLCPWNSLAISAVKEFGGLDYVESQTRFDVRFHSQREMTSRNLRGITSVTTPCGVPPAVRDGGYTLITINMAGDFDSKSYIATYACDDRYRLIGQQTLVCDPVSKRWDSPPVCIRMDYDDSRTEGTSLDCGANPSISEVLRCFPDVTIRWKYSQTDGQCQRFLTCLDSEHGFRSIEDCQRICNYVVRTPEPAITTPAPLYTGGLRGVC